MQEEFHADTINGVFTWKVHYGWSNLTSNIWLPSLCELVGLTGTEHPDVGTYIPAMQGIPNAANDYNVDKNGGEQWAWLVEFNPSGGAAEIWRLCGNTSAWVRSPDKATAISVWAVTSITTISWAQLVTASRAVHPVGYRFKVLFCVYPPIINVVTERSWGRRPCKRSSMQTGVLRQFNINSSMAGRP